MDPKGVAVSGGQKQGSREMKVVDCQKRQDR